MGRIARSRAVSGTSFNFLSSKHLILIACFISFYQKSVISGLSCFILYIKNSYGWISAVKPYLILANGFYLRNISFLGHQSLVLNDLNNAVAIDFDYQEEMIYWSEITNSMSKISRLNLTDHKVSVSTSHYTPPTFLANKWRENISCMVPSLYCLYVRGLWMMIGYDFKLLLHVHLCQLSKQPF